MSSKFNTVNNLQICNLVHTHYLKKCWTQKIIIISTFLSSGSQHHMVSTFRYTIQLVLIYFTLRTWLLQQPGLRHPRSLCQHLILIQFPNRTVLPLGSRYVNINISTGGFLTYEPSITNFSEMCCVPWSTIIRASYSISY